MRKAASDEAHVPEARMEARNLAERVERSRAQAKHVARSATRAAREGARFGKAVAMGLLVTLLCGGIVAAMTASVRQKEFDGNRTHPPSHDTGGLYEIQAELQRLAEEARARDAVPAVTP